MDIATAIISALGAGLGGLGQGMNTQKRESFGPQAKNALNATQTDLGQAYDYLTGQMKDGIQLPDANFSLPTFDGGGLPMPIGLINPTLGSSGGGGIKPRTFGNTSTRPDYSQAVDPSTAPHNTYDPTAYYDQNGNYVPRAGTPGADPTHAPLPNPNDEAEIRQALALLSGGQG